MIAISLDRLEEKFRMDNKVFWKIYAGKGMSPTRRFAQNLSVDQLEDSLSSLMSQLDFANTRFVTIEALSSLGAKNGMCYAVDLGEDRDEKQSQQITGFQYPSGLLGGTGMSYQQMMQQSERIASEKVDLAISKVTAEFEMRLLKGRIEELEDQLEHGGGSIKERLTAKLVDSVPDIIAAITGQQPVTAIGKAGFEEEEEEEAPEQHNRQQAKQGQPAHLSIDRMAYDVHCLQQIFPEHNMNDVLHALLEYAKKNRAQVASLINMISK